VWYAIWGAWIIALILTFGILEGVALARGGMTLSMFMWELSVDWGPFQFLTGFVTGALAVHFFWHWLPPGASSQG
jgi:hypothetical protein